MRVGLDIRELEKGKFTGIGRHLRHFLSYVSDHDQDNEYILFGNQNTDYTSSNNRQQLKIIPEQMTIIWDQVQLPKAIKEEKVDVFLTPYFKAPLNHSSKLVVIINDMIPLVLRGQQNPHGLLKRVYFRFMTQMTTRSANFLISISESTKNDLKRIFKVPDNKVRVVNDSVDERYRRVDAGFEDRLEKYKIHSKYILYVGNMSPHKNIPTLLKAYTQLSEALKEQYQLVLVARKNDQYSRLEQLVHELKIEQRVVFVDNVDEQDLPYIYNGAAMLVFPSFYEGFGLPLIEAMACGTAVVTSNISSMPEIVGDAGILIDPNNVQELTKAMETLLTDDDLRQRLVELGMKRVQKFTVENMATGILNVLKEQVC